MITHPKRTARIVTLAMLLGSVVVTPLQAHNVIAMSAAMSAARTRRQVDCMRDASSEGATMPGTRSG